MKINTASFHSIPEAPHLSPTTHNQKYEKKCWLHAGATFIRGAIKKHYPNQILPEHDALMAELQQFASSITDEYMINRGIGNKDLSAWRKRTTFVCICHEYRLEVYAYTDGMDTMREVSSLKQR